jgi:hypothetical protein
MSKNNFTPQFRWEPYDNIKTGSSLIIGNSGTHSLPLSPSSSPRMKLDDLYANKQSALRRNTEEDLKRLPIRLNNMAASDIPMREDFPREKHMSPILNKATQWANLRSGMPK